MDDRERLAALVSKIPRLVTGSYRFDVRARNAASLPAGVDIGVVARRAADDVR